jgi:hypothetical protein
MSCGEPVTIIPDSVAVKTFEDIEASYAEYSKAHFLAVMECVMEETPEVAE